MRRRLVLATLLSLACLLAAASAALSDDVFACSSFAGPKCSIQLATGITVRYVEVGPRGGPVVFLLHGFPDSGSSWARVVPVLHLLLPAADIIVPDLRGQGQTSMPSGAACPASPESCFGWRQFAADIIAFMDARHIARAAMVGHSVGTLVAQELGLSYPSRVSRLVLVSTAATGQEPAVEGLLQDVIEGEWQQDFQMAGYSWPAGAYLLSPAVAVPDYTDFIDAYESSTVAPEWLLDQVRSEAAPTALGTWLGVARSIVSVDNVERLRHLTVPTLVLYAIQDDVFSPADEQTLIASLQAAAAAGGSFWFKQYGDLPPDDSGVQTDIGHNIPWEAPGGLAEDIASYLVLGRPTRTLFHTDYPRDIHRIIAQPGQAVIVHSP